MTAAEDRLASLDGALQDLRDARDKMFNGDNSYWHISTYQARNGDAAVKVFNRTDADILCAMEKITALRPESLASCPAEKVRYKRVLMPDVERGEAVEVARDDLHVACAVIANLVKGTEAEHEWVNVYMNLLNLMRVYEDAVLYESARQ